MKSDANKNELLNKIMSLFPWLSLRRHVVQYLTVQEVKSHQAIMKSRDFLKVEWFILGGRRWEKEKRRISEEGLR